MVKNDNPDNYVCHRIINYSETNKSCCLTLCLLMTSVDNIDNIDKQSGPRSGPQNVGFELDPNFFILCWYS